jgi:hypothetical protein
MMPDVQRRSVSGVVALEIMEIGLQRLLARDLVTTRIVGGAGLATKKL